MGRLQELIRLEGPMNRAEAKLYRERARRGTPGNKVTRALQQQRHQAEQRERFREEQRTRATNLLARKEIIFAEFGRDAVQIIESARRLTGRTNNVLKPVQRSA